MENNTFRVTTDLWATQGQRLANFFIDLLMRYVLIFVLGFIIALTANFLGNQGVLLWLENIDTLTDYLIGIAVALVYYAAFEVFLSRTIAKYITKTVVVMADGSKPDAGTIIKRTFCRLIPFNQLSFVGSARGWHDSISDTYVVQKELFDEKKRLFCSFEEIGQTNL